MSYVVTLTVKGSLPIEDHELGSFNKWLELEPIHRGGPLQRVSPCIFEGRIPVKTDREIQHRLAQCKWESDSQCLTVVIDKDGDHSSWLIFYPQPWT